jgi:glycosyltransferase involved in cell wall biosynthesis
MKILVYPKANNNLYQELLYSPIKNSGDTVVYLSDRQQISRRRAFIYFIFNSLLPPIDLFLLVPKVTILRLLGYKTLHIHWTYGFVLRARPWRTILGKKILFAHFIFFISTVKFLNYSLVWTAHNAEPHQKDFDDDFKAYKVLAKHSDRIIGNTIHVINEFKKNNIISQDKPFYIIPHGNYVDAYLNNTTKKNARRMVNVSDKEFVFLFFGTIKEYKGIELLLVEYAKIYSNKKKLIIAGKNNNLAVEKKIQDSVISEKTRFFNYHIPDEEVQIYFNASDIVVLPFKSITTSGSAILALSFGKAVIVPNIGDLMYLPDTVAYKYDAEDPEGLYKAMRRAIDNPEEVKEKSRNALIYAKNIPSWEEIAKETRGVFEGCINHTI